MNGTVDENFGLEIMDAVEKVMREDVVHYTVDLKIRLEISQ